MNREQLGKMQLEALRVLGLERGIDNARSLGKADLIERLAPPHTLVERAKEAVAHAVDVVEERAHHLADRVLHRVHPGDGKNGASPGAHSDGADEAAAAEDAAGADDAATREPTGALLRGDGFGVPSSTVHPYVERPPAGEPMSMLDFEELPETYGVDECEVLAKDPFWCFAYWEVTESGLQSARAQLGLSATESRLVLRLFTTVPAPEGVDRQIHDIELPWNHGRRYLSAPRPGAHLRVAVGLLSKEGYFAPIAHSSLLRVPPAEPQPGHVEWMEVVPAKGRGRAKEPLVIVRRGAEHAERGVRAPEPLGGSAGTSPSAANRPGAPGYPFGGSSSSPTRRNGNGGQ
jgi:hypothetical protein